ncbi:MAG: Lrp/AsnC family transcriptional regulator [Candidatus Marsarchaeota archaeon]|nr:Lrp/AsnC family transcriptional regulator [Candidatus Marsarchaeota archaeon]
MAKNIDKMLISKLIEDSDTPIAKLAQALGVSRGTVRNRLASLKSSKVLIGYKARARLKQLGMDEALVGIDILPEKYLDVISRLRDTESVKELYRTSGDHSAIALMVADSGAIESEISKLKGIEGVRNVYPSFVQETVK